MMDFTNMRQTMDFSGMRPSDALAKAHEAFPAVEWEWRSPIVCRDCETGNPCGCAVALLAFAIDRDIFGFAQWHRVGEMFPSIPGAYGDDSPYDRADTISWTTEKATSFPEAVQLLRDAGW